MTIKHNKSMKPFYIIATALIFIAFIIHTIGGELTDIKALLLSSLDDNMQLELRAVWYMVSVDFLISGIFLTYGLRKKTINHNSVLIDFIGIRMLLYGLVFLLLIIFTNCSLLFKVPQWILLFIIAVSLEWNRIKNIFSKGPVR